MRFYYLYLYLLLWIFAFIAPTISIKAQKKILALYCSIWAVTFGFRRYDVGNDTPGYVAFFENRGSMYGYGTVDNPGETIEEGFVVFSKIINLFTENATIVFLGLGIAIWSVIYLLYLSKSKTPLLSLLIMMTITGKIFYTLEIAVRQSMSIFVVLLGILLIYSSKIGKIKDFTSSKRALAGLLLFLFSIMIHRTTGMLVFILFLLLFLKMNKSICYAVVIFFTMIALFFAESFVQLFDYTLLFVGEFSDENVSLLGDRYMGEIDTKLPIRASLIAWPLPTLLTIYLTKKDHINNFVFKVYIFVFCLHQMMQYSTMHDRLTTLFIIIGFVASVPEICVSKRKWYYTYLLIAMIYIFLDYRMFDSWNVKADAALPYYFIWE